MHGFEHLRKDQRLEIDNGPTPADLLTYDKTYGIGLLIPNAKAMTSAEIEYIAKSDYQMDVDPVGSLICV